MITLIRGIITSFAVKAGKLAMFSASGRTGETFTDRVAFQHFGFASGLPKGTEAILLKTGQNVYLVASDSRKYRLSIEAGECQIYNENGDNIHLKKDHTIEVNAVGLTSKVVVNAGSVELGGPTKDPTDGVVTGKCNCVYGAPHPVISSVVKAKFLPS